MRIISSPYIKQNYPKSYNTVNFTANKDNKSTKAGRYVKFMEKGLFPTDGFRYYNTNWLNGIQSDIKIFDNLTMKQIAFILDNLDAIAIKRGCNNKCLHCFADAKPTVKEYENFISRMPFETYKELTDGFKVLRQKMKMKHLLKNEYFVSLFYDSDCMDITLRDKNGKEHDFIELAEMYYNATGNKTIFDTAGWFPKNTLLQERAENYVQKLADNDCFAQINLSMSPFNPIYAKAIEFGYDPFKKDVEKNSENYQKAKKCYDLYINRMANMLYTFTPIIWQNNVNVIARPVKNNIPEMKEFNFKSYRIIQKDVLKRLEEMYKNDLNGEQKYIKDEESMLSTLKRFNELTSNVAENLSMSGRMRSLYEKKAPYVLMSYDDYNVENYIYETDNYEYTKKHQKTPLFAPKYKSIIDANGNIYLNGTYRVIPTELKLNLSTKDNETPPLLPTENDGFVMTNAILKI